jgi:RHS repeat-associated protein
LGQAATHHGELRLYLAGQQVAQAITSEGTTTTTLTKGENVPGVCSVVLTGSGPSETVSYVATDGLGSVSEALSSSGTVTAQQLDGPYGVGRYASGTMPTAKGYTGQYADAASSGLDDYQARYYDAVLGQFASAESDAAGGLNRYASVHGNPETATDPTGHYRCDETGCSRGHHNHGRGGCTYDCGSGGQSGGSDGLCNQARCKLCKHDCGNSGPKAAGGSARKPTQGGVPNDAIWSWSDPGHHIVVYLRGPEYDPRSGWHFNLVIKRWNGPDIYNYHLYHNGAWPPKPGSCTCGGMGPDSPEEYLWKAVETLYSSNKADGTTYWLPFGDPFPVAGDLEEMASLSASALASDVYDNIISVAGSMGIDPAVMDEWMSGTTNSNSYWASAQGAFTAALTELWALKDAPPPS